MESIQLLHRPQLYSDPIRKDADMNSLEELWSHILATMFEKKPFSEASFNLWLKDMQLIELTKTSVYLSVPNEFKLRFISQKYMEFIREILTELVGAVKQIVLISQESAIPDVAGAIEEFLQTGEDRPYLFCYRCREGREESAPAEPEPEESTQKPAKEGPGGGMYLNYSEKFTFENFIVGSTNQFAYNACKAVAANPADRYNPLFIWGPSGLGKTHLLYAITNQILKDRPQSQVLYVRGEDFTNQLVESLTQKEPMHYFREKYRNVDVLLVDDIQFIAGKTATQEEFFHTFNALHQQNKQIILTSDRPPKEINTLEDRLKSRFEWGLIADVAPPDLELRIAILRRKCEEMGLMIDASVLEYVAEQIKENIRQLEGAAKKLAAQSFINGQSINLPLAKTILRDIVTGNEPPSVTVDKIFRVVSETLQIPLAEIKGRKRTKEIATARHLVEYLLSTMVDIPSTNIARMFDQDHTSALHAIDKIDKLIKTDSDFAAQVERIQKTIRG